VAESQDTNTDTARQPRSGWRFTAMVIATAAVIGIAHFLQPLTEKLSETLTETDDHRSGNAEDAGPDLTISDATITSFRETGELRYRLQSPQIEHFAPGDRTYLQLPDLMISRDPDPPWRITSARGTISNTSGRDGAEEEVLLEDHVHMEQRFTDGRNYVLVTPAITVYPERQYAETTRDVMITTHAGRTRAVGLEGNLRQGLLKLFSNDEQRVHTVILPDQFK